MQVSTPSVSKKLNGGAAHFKSRPILSGIKAGLEQTHTAGIVSVRFAPSMRIHGTQSPVMSVEHICESSITSILIENNIYNNGPSVYRNTIGKYTNTYYINIQPLCFEIRSWWL